VNNRLQRSFYALRRGFARARPGEVVQLVALALSVVSAVIAAFSFFTGVTSLKVPTAEAQIRELQGLRQALNDLDRFIEVQQRSIASSEATLADLRRRQSELNKVVSVNADAAEALLRYQEQRQSRHAWIGYAISFVLGILSSLTATAVLSLARRGKPLVSPIEALKP
jgi:predicted PurR-regulated permease PerM